MTAQSSTDDLATPLSRQNSGLSAGSNQSVAGSTASSFRKRLKEISRPSPTTHSQVAIVAPVSSRHRSLHEVLDHTRDQTGQLLKTPRDRVDQMRKSYREKRALEAESAKTTARLHSASKTDNASPSRETNTLSASPKKSVPANTESGGDDNASRERRHTIDRIKDRIRNRRRSGEKSPDMDARNMPPVDEKIEGLREGR